MNTWYSFNTHSSCNQLARRVSHGLLHCCEKITKAWFVSGCVGTDFCNWIRMHVAIATILRSTILLTAISTIGKRWQMLQCFADILTNSLILIQVLLNIWISIGEKLQSEVQSSRKNRFRYSQGRALQMLAKSSFISKCSYWTCGVMCNKISCHQAHFVKNGSPSTSAKRSRMALTEFINISNSSKS